MYLQLNHVEKSCIKIPQSLVDSMTREEALQMALSHSEVQQALGVYIVKDATLEVRRGYDLTLNIVSVKPEGMENIPKQPKEKKKKKLKAVKL